MQVISMPRGMGKTTVLVEWLRRGRKDCDVPGSGNRTLLVHTEAHADNLRRYHNLSNDEVVVFGKNLFGFPAGREIAIDEIGLFLADIFPSNTKVVYISTSPEETE